MDPILVIAIIVVVCLICLIGIRITAAIVLLSIVACIGFFCYQSATVDPYAGIGHECHNPQCN